MKPTTLEPLLARTIGSGEMPLSRQSIDQWQLQRLRAQLDYCREHSPFYRRHVQGIDGTAFQGLGDIAALPLTTEADLRAHGPEMVCVSQDAVARIITMRSSGTTGPPKRLYFTGEDLEQTLHFFHLGMQQMVDSGQSVAILLPGATPDSTGHLLARALERFLVSSHILGLVTQPEEAVRTLARLQPDVLVGFPVQILATARMAEFMGISLGTIRSVLLCSDAIPDSLGRELTALLGCEIFTHYGTTETGLGGGVDCAAHNGCHLREADLLFEIIDPQTTLPLADGQWGEIVFTTLTRTGMPLIRYRTGDIGRFLPGNCPCGSTIRRLDQVRGRIDQIRTLKNGSRLDMRDLDEALFPLPGLLDFNARLEESDGREQLHLSLKLLPSRSTFRQQPVRELLSAVPALTGLSLTLDAPSETTIHPAKRTLEDHRKDILS
jgi:phenylacetate-coenzyme A ligase PaaK-like adenylate-forming protein